MPLSATLAPTKPASERTYEWAKADQPGSRTYEWAKADVHWWHTAKPATTDIQATADVHWWHARSGFCMN